MKTVGIVDAELAVNGEGRFPNLAAMKLSSYHKERGDLVTLVPNFKYLADFDSVYVCCVFTEVARMIPANIRRMRNVRCGGTGFSFDKATPLPRAVEHSPPDYDLYRDWVHVQLTKRSGRAALRYYTDYSLGFLTRGCFRRCQFCVNRNSRKAVRASSLREFHNPKRNRICLLDDNFLAYHDRETLLADLIDTCERTGASFEFKQGLDIRLLTRKVATQLQEAPTHGEIIFAFDSIKDAVTVRRGLEVFRKHLPNKGTKCYILCGFEDNGWRDIATVFRRLQILWNAGVIGYVMRHENCRSATTECFGIYTQLARWCNQPKFQRSASFREFCDLRKGTKKDLAMFERIYPTVAKEYFNLKFNEENCCPG